MTGNQVRQLALTALTACLLALCGCTDKELVPPPPEQSVTINPDPDTIDAPWQLAVPGGLLVSSSGDTTLTDMPTGAYSLTWGAVPGWTLPTPPVASLTLQAGRNIVFAGTYLESQALPGFSTVAVEAGTFLMGAPPDELGSGEEERPRHQVEITAQLGRDRPFVIGVTEVTQQLYEAVMGSNPSWFAGCDDCPVERVSWFDVIQFCNALSAEEGLQPAYQVSGQVVTWNLAAEGYRLPTEAEWEYACRAGQTTAFTNGGISATGCAAEPTLEAVGWFCGNADATTHPVAGKVPNAWGLHDMHGNVWEWVWDLFGAYPADLQTDPTGPVTGSFQVIRGGSWLYGAQRSRSAYRHRASPGSEASDLGFRLARFVNAGQVAGPGPGGEP